VLTCTTSVTSLQRARFLQQCVHVRRAVTPHELARRAVRIRFADEHEERGAGAGLELEAAAQRGARIERGAAPGAERRARHQCLRRLESAVTPEEFAPVAGPFDLAAAEIGKRHAGEGGVPGIVREQCAGVGVMVRDDVRGARTARRGHDPLEVRGDRQRARPRRVVAYHQARELDRIVLRHQQRQLQAQPVRALLEAAVTKAVRA
jgi:hypothetical protein